jgi:hypothetical protein
MADYRACIVGRNGHFISYRVFVCDDDNGAIDWANQLVDGDDIELGNEDRFVLRLVPRWRTSRLRDDLTFYLHPHSH